MVLVVNGEHPADDKFHKLVHVEADQGLFQLESTRISGYRSRNTSCQILTFFAGARNLQRLRQYPEFPAEYDRTMQTVLLGGVPLIQADGFGF